MKAIIESRQRAFKVFRFDVKRSDNCVLLFNYSEVKGGVINEGAITDKSVV